MKKKMLALFLAAVMTAGILPGCSSGSDDSSADAASTDSATEESSADGTEAELEETGELTIYYSNSTDWADPIIEEFEETYGITVSGVQDGTSSLFARVKAEEANPQGDIIWGGVIDTYRANEDLLQPYTTSNVEYLKEAAIDENGYYTGFDMGPMVMVYNTDLISEDEAPTSWADLLDEKYFGQIACADPTSSSSSFACIMAIILAYGTDDGAGYDFVEQFVANLDGKVLESSSAVYRGVADGEYLVGLTYEEAAIRYIESGASLEIVYPSEGTSSSPSGSAIIKDCPNLYSAQLFMDFLTSKEVQEQLGGLYRRSVRTDVEDPDTMKAWEEIEFVTMDIEWTSSHTDEFTEKWMDFLTQ